MRYLVLPLLLAVPAHAQDAVPPPAPDAADSSAEDPGARLLLRLKGVTIQIESVEIEMIVDPDEIDALLASPENE